MSLSPRSTPRAAKAAVIADVPERCMPMTKTAAGAIGAVA